MGRRSIIDKLDVPDQIRTRLARGQTQAAIAGWLSELAGKRITQPQVQRWLTRDRKRPKQHTVETSEQAGRDTLVVVKSARRKINRTDCAVNADYFLRAARRHIEDMMKLMKSLDIGDPLKGKLAETITYLIVEGHDLAVDNELIVAKATTSE